MHYNLYFIHFNYLGFGSSNDGNTARRFFEQEEISSEITGIDRMLIHRLSIILTALNTSKQLDAKKFHSYAIDTVKIIDEKYKWWPMSPTVHKVLIHGADVVSHAILPLGVLFHKTALIKNITNVYLELKKCSLIYRSTI